MRYRLFARDHDGRELTLSGFKELADDPGFDVWTDTTTLFIRILSGRVDQAAEDADEAASAGRTVADRHPCASPFHGFHAPAQHRARGRRLDGRAGERDRALRAAVLRRALGACTAAARWPGTCPTSPTPTTTATPLGTASRPASGTQSEELPGVWRRILPVTAGDWARRSPCTTCGPARTPSPSAGPSCSCTAPACAPTCSTVRRRTAVRDALVDAGYDVWASNWRASIDLPDHPYTLDQAALYDHPATIRAILQRPGASA